MEAIKSLHKKKNHALVNHGYKLKGKMRRYKVDFCHNFNFISHKYDFGSHNFKFMIHQNMTFISYVEEMGWLVKQRQYAWSQGFA